MEKHYIARSMDDVFEYIDRALIDSNFCMKIIDVPSIKYTVDFIRRIVETYGMYIIEISGERAQLRINDLKIYIFPLDQGSRIVIIGTGYCGT